MPVGVKDVRGLLGGSVLSLSLSVEAIRDEQAGREAGSTSAFANLLLFSRPPRDLPLRCVH